MATIYGTAGADNRLGTATADTIFGWAEDGSPSDDLGDTLRGQGGDDSISGGNGEDRLIGAFGDDTIRGGAERDIIFGHIRDGDRDPGDDVLFGDGGNDHLSGAGGLDRLSGGAGDDVIRSIDRDIIQGGAGFDICLFDRDDATVDITFSLRDEGDSTILFDGTRVGSIEAISFVSGSGSDSLAGLDAADALGGNGGNDTLNGRGGNDVLNGGPGSDDLIGGAGDDFMDGSHASDLVRGGRGDDTLQAGHGGDTLMGGEGNDLLREDLRGFYAGGDGATDFFLFEGNFGVDTLLGFITANDESELVFVGFTNEDLTVIDDGSLGHQVSLVLDDGTFSGTVHLDDIKGSFTDADYSFA